MRKPLEEPDLGLFKLSQSSTRAEIDLIDTAEITAKNITRSLFDLVPPSTTILVSAQQQNNDQRYSNMAVVIRVLETKDRFNIFKKKFNVNAGGMLYGPYYMAHAGESSLKPQITFNKTYSDLLERKIYYIFFRDKPNFFEKF